MYVPSIGLISGESGGNPAARNPNSTAAGLLQITAPMWQGLQKNYPNAGLTDRTDPAQAKLAYGLFMDNEGVPALQQHNLENTEANRDRIWHWGTPAAIDLMKADPGAAVGDVLGKNAAAIVRANPRHFPQGINTPVADALAASDGDYTQKGQAQMAGPMMQAALGQPQTTGYVQPITAQAPVAPTLQAPESRPSSPLANILTYLANWGAGAGQGRTAGESLGMGASAGLQALQQQRAQDDQQRNAASQIAQQNFENQIKQAGAQQDIDGAAIRRAATIAQLHKSGMSASNIVAALNGGELNDSDMQSVQRAAAGSVSPYSNPTPMAIDTPDGTMHVTQGWDKTTGKTFLVDNTGNPVDPALAARAYPLNDPEHQMEAKRNATQLDAAEQEADAARKTATIAQQIQTVLPSAGAGTSLSARATRQLASLSGHTIDGTDPDAAQYADSLFAQLKSGVLHGVMAGGVGRLDRPEQDMIMHSVNSAHDSNPAVLSATLTRYQEVNDYKQKQLQAFYDAPYSIQRKGYSAFAREYETNKDTAPHFSSFMDNVNAYKAAQEAHSTAQQAPTMGAGTSGGSSKVGPAAPATPSWHIIQ